MTKLDKLPIPPRRHAKAARRFGKAPAKKPAKKAAVGSTLTGAKGKRGRTSAGESF